MITTIYNIYNEASEIAEQNARMRELVGKSADLLGGNA
jgi:hypothetical protein